MSKLFEYLEKFDKNEEYFQAFMDEVSNKKDIDTPDEATQIKEELNEVLEVFRNAKKENSIRKLEEDLRRLIGIGEN